jgi:hypothetical protein
VSSAIASAPRSQTRGGVRGRVWGRIACAARLPPLASPARAAVENFADDSARNHAATGWLVSLPGSMAAFIHSHAISISLVLISWLSVRLARRMHSRA